MFYHTSRTFATAALRGAVFFLSRISASTPNATLDRIIVPRLPGSSTEAGISSSGFSLLASIWCSFSMEQYSLTLQSATMPWCLVVPASCWSFDSGT